MIRFANEIAALLAGTGRAVAWAFVLSAASAVLDLACMVLLPVFLFTTLSGSAAHDPRIPFVAILRDWLPTYRSLAVAVVTVFVLRGLYSLYIGGRLSRLSEMIRAALIGRLAQFYLTCPYQDFTGRSVAWAQTMIGNYTGSFAGSVALPLLRLLLDVLTMIAILGFLMVLDHRVVGVTVGVLCIVAVSYYLSVRRVSERQSRRLAGLQVEFSQDLSRALHSPREVRVFQLQSHFVSGMRDALARGADAQARLIMIGSLPRVLGELTLIGLALGYLAYRTHGGTGSTLLVSQLGLLAFAGLRLLPTFAQILSNVSALRAGRHVTGLLAEELARVRPVVDAALPPSGVDESAGSFQSLELRNVSFAYEPTARPILDGITFAIRRGQSIGVIGVSGAGKSTLADLILGLLPPTSGETLINGHQASLGSAAWWNTVGFVPQAVFLSNDTLLRNIAFGVPAIRIDRARVLRACSLAQLDDVVRGLPHGLDSAIGDYGVKLSGGQRQRVAIARALYHERQFLVLDEATSALDMETEKAVVAAVGSLRGTVTTFIIAHRRSTLESCDAVIEIQAGRIKIVDKPRVGATASA